MRKEQLFLDLLQELSSLGAAMRSTMTKTLCDPVVSKNHIFNLGFLMSKASEPKWVNPDDI